MAFRTYMKDNANVPNSGDQTPAPQQPPPMMPLNLELVPPVLCRSFGMPMQDPQSVQRSMLAYNLNALRPRDLEVLQLGQPEQFAQYLGNTGAQLTPFQMSQLASLNHQIASLYPAFSSSGAGYVAQPFPTGMFQYQDPARAGAPAQAQPVQAQQQSGLHAQPNTSQQNVMEGLQHVAPLPFQGGIRLSHPGVVSTMLDDGNDPSRAKRAFEATTSGTVPCMEPVKRSRLVWTPELHQRFEEAVEKAGGLDVAVPKVVLEHMAVSGLTRDNVASHLQKHRMHVKKKLAAQQAQQSQQPIAGTTAPTPGQSGAGLVSGEASALPPSQGTSEQTGRGDWGSASSVSPRVVREVSAHPQQAALRTSDAVTAERGSILTPLAVVPTGIQGPRGQQHHHRRQPEGMSACAGNGLVKNDAQSQTQREGRPRTSAPTGFQAYVPVTKRTGPDLDLDGSERGTYLSSGTFVSSPEKMTFAANGVNNKNSASASGYASGSQSSRKIVGPAALRSGVNSMFHNDEAAVGNSQSVGNLLALSSDVNGGSCTNGDRVSNGAGSNWGSNGASRIGSSLKDNGNGNGNSAVDKPDCGLCASDTGGAGERERSSPRNGYSGTQCGNAPGLEQSMCQDGRC